MHELKPRSLGGKESRDNSIAVCGDGVRGCHGLLQRKEIKHRFDRRRSADGWMAFRPLTDAAKEYTGINPERASDATPRETKRKGWIKRPTSPLALEIDRACGITDSDYD